jgi:hypothetical protein
MFVAKMAIVRRKHRVFLVRNFAKRPNKKRIFCRKIPFFNLKTAKFRDLKKKNISPHLDCAFSLVAVLKLVLVFEFSFWRDFANKIKAEEEVKAVSKTK